ncbi:class I SAM-dependent methyltransferase [Ascidiimonas sp. W6]|uniref:class I SAM-dependent methyltransferase n=1 Tax=Ascidiimonas meishanensis TaxID=3128903 RepID=UPI0030EEA74E
MEEITKLIGNTDIYVIDQILKGRYSEGQKILDAGCGYGRNLKWFFHNKFDIYGVDCSEEAILEAKIMYAESAGNFIKSDIKKMPFKNHFFDHIITSAVLHFANDKAHFYKMISELERVLKVKGSLLVRMASSFATNNAFEHIQNGIYALRDGDERFLMNQEILDTICNDFKLSLIEPIKTTNVNDLRCMTTLVFEKV